MQKLFTLAKNCDAQALTNINLFSLHEFVTISQFYIANLPLISRPLINGLLDKIVSSITEFNELQLVLFSKTLERMFIQERQQAQNVKENMFNGDKALFDKVELCYYEVMNELEKCREEKQL